MPDLYYTAITVQTGDTYSVATETIGEGKDAREFVYAEHFESESDMHKRARQFETQARQMDAPNGDAHKVYSGTEPPEAFIARLTFRGFEPDDESPDDFNKELDAACKAAGAKTVSVLTAPELDDTQENRPLPPLALALSAVEAAEQAVMDAQAGVDQLQTRADDLAEAAKSTDPDGPGPEAKAALAQKARGALAEVDQARARLYHAQNDLEAKQKAVEELKAREA